MASANQNKDISRWGKQTVEPGEAIDTSLLVSESYTGTTVRVPVHVWRAPEPGPAVFITAAVHGDEINGTGTIRHLLVDPPFELRRGTLVLVPVVNILGFERHSRYLPDRRDLNRSFPGSDTGSLTSRLANVIFEKVVKRCDYGIDLHTAAVRRTNFPNVRADLSDPGCAALAEAFGAEVVLEAAGPQGSLRREAVRSGRPTILLEAGEVWKVEPSVVEYTLRGIRNVLRVLKMIRGKPVPPPYRVNVQRTQWIRADVGGFLQFHVTPGELVEKGTPIATNTSLLGRDRNVVTAPRGGLILGMTTLPSVAPGDPIVHLAFPRKGGIERIERAVEELAEDSLYERLRDDLASNVHVSDPTEREDD